MGKVVLDDKQWRTFLGKIYRDLRNPLEKLSVLGSTMGYSNIIDHFRKEEGPDGEWPKRLPKTQLAYKRLNKKSKVYNPSNKLLQLRGNLRKDIRIARREKRHEKVGNQGVRLFTVIPYAGKHNYGDKDMRQREFMYLDDETQQKMVDALIAWIADLGR